MSCLLRRNAEGSIVEVTTPSGQKSKLFEAVHGNVFMADAETSAKITSIAYTDRMQNKFPKGSKNTYDTGEPKLFYQTVDDTIYEDLEDVFVNRKEGKVVAGFLDAKDDFTPVFSFSTNEGQLPQFFTNQILEGVLSPTRILGEDGITRLQGKGEFTETKIATAQIFAINARTQMAYGNVSVNKEDGTIELNVPNDLIAVELKNGSYEYMSKEDALASDEVANKELILTNEILSKIPLTRASEKITVRRSDKELITALQNFLSSLGFSTTSLEAYQKRYNTVYGKDPDIQALSDITNRVVAFSQGQLTLENLSEEVAHIALEAYSEQGSIVEAMAVAHLTPEYAQYADYYRKKYAPFYQDVALEDQVRKEVLGKILAKEFQTNFRAVGREQEGTTIVERLKGIWEAFINYISGSTKPYHIRLLNELNKDIVDSIASRNLQKFQKDLTNNTNFFYSAMSEEHKRLQQNLISARKLIESSAKVEGGSLSERKALERIDDEIDEINLLNTSNTIIGIVERKVNELRAELKATEGKTGIDGILSVKGESIAVNLKEYLVPLITSINVSLKELRKNNSFENPKAKEILEKTIKEISSSVTNISEESRVLLEEVRRNRENKGDRVVEQAIAEQSFSKDEADKLRNQVNSTKGETQKDFGFLAKYFGIPSEMSNPVLGLISKVAQNMEQKVRLIFNSTAGDIVSNILRTNATKFQTAIIQKDEKGRATHFIKGPMNWYLAEKLEREKKIKLIETLAKLNRKEAEENLDSKTISEIFEKDQTKIEAYNKAMTEYREEMEVKPMKPEYYREQREKFDRLKISLISNENIKAYNYRVNEITGQYRNKDGTIDKSRLTEAEKETINQVKKEREMDKSPYNNQGEIKEGLRVIPSGELTQEDIDAIFNMFGFTIPADYKGDVITLRKGLTVDDLTDKARLALDMNNLSYDFQFNTSKDSLVVTEAFKSKVRDLQEKATKGEIAWREVYDWVESNSNISFSDEYYESLGDPKRLSFLLNKLNKEGLTNEELQEYENLLGTSVTYGSQVEAYINSIKDATKQITVRNWYEEYKEVNRKRKYLLKQNKKAGGFLDVNAHGMGEENRKQIIRLEDRAAKIREQIALPKAFKEELKGEVFYEITDDFFRMAREAGLAEEGDLFTFAQRHMTPANASTVQDFAIQIERLLTSSTVTIDKRFEEFFDKLDEEGFINDGMPVEQVIAIAKDEFAKTKLASYFKRYEPSTFQSVSEALKNGEVDFIKFLERDEATLNSIPGLRFIKINPDFSWQKDIVGDKSNPMYKKGGYYKQLGEKLIDQEWFDFYGIKVEDYMKLSDDDISKLIPTQNIEQFQYLVQYMKLKEAALEQLGDTQVANKWLRTQIKKSSSEDLLALTDVKTKLKSVKDVIASIYTDQKDEVTYGETTQITDNSGVTNVRVIPKYFQRRLEDPDLLSEATFSAVLLELKEAIAYNEKSKSIRDIRALTEKLANQDFVESGSTAKGNLRIKKGQTTNQMEAATNFINAKFYGVQQVNRATWTLFGTEVDFSRVVKAIQKFSTFSNLGYNFFVDATGATTGMTNNLIDRLVGEYFHKSSINKSTLTALDWSKDYLIELESLDRKSKLGKWFEVLGVTDVTERIADSNVSFVGRLAKNSPYLASKVSNLFLSPKIAIAALYDYRLHNGKFVSFQNFVKELGNEVASNGSTTNLTTAEIENRWNNLSEKSLMNYMDFTGSTATYNEEYKKLHSTKEQADEAFQQLLTRVSSKVQKAIMNSDGVINNADKVAAQRDAFANILMQHKGWIPILYTRRFKNLSYNFSTEKYEEGSYRTIGRLLTEFLSRKKTKTAFRDLKDFEKRNLLRGGIDFAIASVLLIIGEAILAADDDDDTLFENLFQLIYLRTTSEVVSSTALGMAGTVQETLEDPIPALNTYMLLQPYEMYKDFSKEDEEFGNKFFKRIAKNTPYKIISRFEDVQTNIDNFRYYNDPTLLNLGKFSENQAAKAERVGLEGLTRQ